MSVYQCYEIHTITSQGLLATITAVSKWANFMGLDHRQKKKKKQIAASLLMTSSTLWTEWRGNMTDMSCVPFKVNVGYPAGTFSELWLMFWQDSLKIMNKHSLCNINRTLVQSYLVFNNILKKIVMHKNLIDASFMDTLLFFSEMLLLLVHVTFLKHYYLLLDSECSENVQN